MNLSGLRMEKGEETIRGFSMAVFHGLEVLAKGGRQFPTQVDSYAKAGMDYPAADAGVCISGPKHLCGASWKRIAMDLLPMIRI